MRATTFLLATGAVWLGLAGMLAMCAAEPAAAETEKKVATITAWLQAGPLSEPLPAFHDVKNLQGKAFELKNLLEFEHAEVKRWWPAAGDAFTWSGAQAQRWQVVNAGAEQTLSLPSSEGDGVQFVYLATYLDASRWCKAKLEVRSHHLLQLFLDGEALVSKASSEKTKDDGSAPEPGKAEKEIKLEAGKHLLLIKALRDPGNSQPWQVTATLQIDAGSEDALALTTLPQQPMSIRHLLDVPQVNGISVSANGELTALTLQRALPPSDDSESWIELRRFSDGKLVQTYRGGMQLSRVNWAPVGKKFSYTSSGKDGRTLWIVDLDQGTSTPLLENVKELGGHTWAPDGSYLIYSVTEKFEEDKSGIRLLKGMPDRQPGYRDRSFLYQVHLADGSKRRLTAGELSTSLHSISPDGSRLLFTRSYPDFGERPFSKSDYFLLRLGDMSTELLFTTGWGGSAQFSPDGTKLLVTGSPVMFGDTGANVPEGMIPNDYDTQAYIYDLASKAVEPISRDFDPAIDEALWHKSGRALYFVATDKSYRRLFRYDLQQKRFEPLATGVEVLGSVAIAENKPVAVYTGSGAADPPKAYALDLAKKQPRLLLDPARDDFATVSLGEVKPWRFTNSRGTEIEGRVYYPPGFDPAKKYPCIVYYYGGTVPVTRDFGGRYPKNLYAAQGYVVYVLQPSGATGFGQAFSALHVNDWGRIVADEIIDGVKQFLAAHPFVDAGRVGCIGASYGGFMTMLLQTRTDMFAAAVSHAGISDITSYWGEGYWGYLYSTVAAANSYPWSHRELFVEQSPLFHADKITTPLLLLHGMADTNVPPGESIQLYTALKLLGKEVEFIQVADQNHHILQYTKRKQWTKSILAWFDRWLKEQPAWWDDLYGDKRE